MFVVKRAFRDTFGMIPAGSVVEPAGIKRFKHRLSEGHIVEVNEQNFDQYAWFFKQRYGISIQLPNTKNKEQVSTKAEPSNKPAVAAKPAQTKKVAVVSAK